MDKSYREASLQPLESTRSESFIMRDNGDNPIINSPSGSALSKIAYISSYILAVACLAIVIHWINMEKVGGGGLSWTYGESGKIFNWHPLLMITSFVFMTISSIIFRFPMFQKQQDNISMEELSSRRRIFKGIHVVSWVIAFITGGVGTYAVVRSHNDPVSGYVANLYSFHSWIGCAVLGLFVLQFNIGIFFLGIGNISIIQRMLEHMSILSGWNRLKKMVVFYHKKIGVYIYYLFALAILLGILEKETFMGCSYKVEEADLKPYAHWSEIPTACKVSHTLGIMVVCLTFSTGYLLRESSHFNRQTLSNINTEEYSPVV